MKTSYLNGKENAINYCDILFTLYPLTAEETGRKGVHLKYKSQSKHPLHDYGKGPFCEFDAPDEIRDKKGLYIFVVDGRVKYIGRCRDSFEKRISKGYGHISPRNCYKGGQPTNCHINNKLYEAFEQGSEVFLGVHVMTDVEKICSLEKEILKKQDKTNPDNWNIQH